jgi:hypothetical protein
LISYDFNLPCALEHYIAGGWALVPQAIQTEWARYIYFHNPSPRFSFKVFLSPSDWIDTRIVFPIES